MVRYLTCERCHGAKGRGKAIYLRDRTGYTKIGDLCRTCVAEIFPRREDSPGTESGREIVDMVLPRGSEKADKDVAHWREVSDLGKKVLLGNGKVHCDKCGCDNVPDYDNWDHPVCGSCGARLEVSRGAEP